MLAKKKPMTKSQRRKKAISQMVKTKSELARLKDAQRAHEIISNGGTLEDIFREFNCTTIQQALRHIRDALRLGGRILGAAISPVSRALSQGPSVITPPSLGRGGTRPAEPTRVTSDVDLATSAVSQLIQFSGRQFSREANEFFEIKPNDDHATIIGKVVRKFYGPP